MSDHFFKSLKIENFRGIESLEIKDLARVNLFVGRNNVGKTTVLESVFLLTGISNPALIIAIDNFRNLTLKSGSALRNFYYRRDHEAGLCLSGNQETGRRELAVEPFYMEQSQRTATPNSPENGNAKYATRSGSASSDLNSDLKGLKYAFSISQDQEDSYKAAVWLKKPGETEIEWETSGEYIEQLSSRFATPKFSFNSEAIDEMLDAKQKSLIVETLRVIEESIVDIRVGTSGIVSIDIGYDSFMPINLLGDGMIHILKLVSDIASVRSGIYIVDEIGNGLHVSAVPSVWKMVLNQSKAFNVQIFATTHSKDVVEGLQEMMENREIEEGEISIYLMDKTTKGGVKAYKKSTKQMVRAWEAGSDIRS